MNLRREIVKRDGSTAMDTGSGPAGIIPGIVRQHVVIRRPEYVAGTAKRPEVGVFTQAHGGRRPVPWGQIDVGDIVWMKWSGGPIVAKARVASFTCIEGCTAARLRKTVEGYRLHGLSACWKALMQRGPFFGMAVFLEDEEWLAHALTPVARSRSESWIVLDTAAARKDWLGHAADEKAQQGSRTVPEGLRFKVYRCSGAVSGGFCGNRIPVREDVLVDAAVAESRRMLLHSDLHDRLRAQVEARLKTFRVHAEDEQRRLENQLRRLDGEVERLIMFIRSADIDPSTEAYAQLRESLGDVTTEQRAVRDKLNSVRQQAKSPPRLPSVDEILERALDVEARIKDDPTTAREAIRRMLHAGKIVMHPQPDGSYRAESSIFPLRLPKSRKPRNPKVSEASHEVVENDGCAGAMCGLEHSVEELWEWVVRRAA